MRKLQKDPSTYFKIGMARSPCDYILSVWTFQGTERGQRNHGIQQECLDSKLGKKKHQRLYVNLDGRKPSPKDVELFKKWVFLSAGRRVHYLGYRQCLSNLSSRDEQDVFHALDTVNISARYDCIL